MELKNKHLIVTGGVKGLGRCLVEHLVQQEAKVTVFDCNAAGLNALSRDLPVVRVVECDISDYGLVAEAFQNSAVTKEPIDALINNAGILYSEPLIRITAAGLEKHGLQAWRKVLGADLDSVFNMTVHVAEQMVKTRTKGVIVNISSVSAAGNAGQSAYSAAKAAVNALTMTWAKELAPLGIRVAAIAPGFSDTESTHKVLCEAVLHDVVKKVPLKRLGRPEEIASGILWILGNDFFTGKILELDGGLTL